jgi:hypothetical protein
VIPEPRAAQQAHLAATALLDGALARPVGVPEGAGAGRD